MAALAFTVPGEVRGKARPRIVKIGGFSRLTADKKTASYENLVALACREAMGAREPLEGAVSLTITARFMPPASASKKARAAMLRGDVRPTKKPDWDNIGKVSDALNGIAWRDDAQVVAGSVFKVFSEIPGLDVRIEQYQPQESGL